MANQVGAGMEGVVPVPVAPAPVAPSQSPVATPGTPAEARRDRSNDPDFIAATSALQSQRDKAINERDREVRLRLEAEAKLKIAEEQTLSANVQTKLSALRERGMDEHEAQQFVQSDLEQARNLRKQNVASQIRAAVAREFSSVEITPEDLAAIPLGEDPGAYEDRLRASYERRQATKEVAEANRLRDEAVRQAHEYELRSRNESGADRLSGHAEPESADDVEAAYKRELKAAAHKPNEVKAVLRKYRGRVPDLS